MIDTEQLCPRCMNEWVDHAEPCPRCGFHGVDELTGEIWKDFTIVDGKYLVGTAIAQSSEGITYIAMDLADEKIITLRPTAEGFAVGEYAPSEFKHTPHSSESRKKRNILAPILCAVGAVGICAFLAMHFGLLGVHSADTASEDDVYSGLRHVFAENGTFRDDGSLWLPTGEGYAICSLSHNENGSVSAGQWETNTLKSYSYEFMDSGDTAITCNHHSKYYDNTYRFEYNADEKLCRTAVISSEGYQQVTEYDYQGDQVNISYYHNGEQAGEGAIVYTYQEDESYMVEATETSLEGMRITTTECDKDGKVISLQDVCTSEGGDNYSSTTYEYDDTGNMIQRDTYEFDAEGGETYSCEVYDYDSQGNVNRRIETTSDADSGRSPVMSTDMNISAVCFRGKAGYTMTVLLRLRSMNTMNLATDLQSILTLTP